MDVLCSPPQWVTPQRAVALGRHEGATAASAVPVPNISLITEFKSHLAPHEPSASAGHHQDDVTSLSHLLNDSLISPPILGSLTSVFSTASRLSYT